MSSISSSTTFSSLLFYHIQQHTVFNSIQCCHVINQIQYPITIQLLQSLQAWVSFQPGLQPEMPGLFFVHHVPQSVLHLFLVHFILNEYLKRNVKFDCRILKSVPKQDSWPNQIEINKKICSRKHECASTYGTYMLGTAELFMYWHNNIPITLYVKQKVLHVGQFFNYDLCTFCILYACDRWHGGSAWQHGNQTWFSLVSRWTRPDKFIHFYSVPFVVRSRESHR